MPISNKPYQTKAAELKPEWHLVDAADKTLGRLSSEIAVLLQGKHKPIYVPHLNTGDYVIVVNAEKIRVTGQQDAAEDVLPAQRLSRRLDRAHAGADAGQDADARHHAVGQGHAAEERAGQAHARPNEGLCRTRPSTPGADGNQRRQARGGSLSDDAAAVLLRHGQAQVGGRAGSPVHGERAPSW